MDDHSIRLILSVIVLLCTGYSIVNLDTGKRTPERHLCKGTSRCFEGRLEEIIDGDTLLVDEEVVRLSLVDAPEKDDDGYDEAIVFVEKKCPIGSDVIIDEDDMQTSRSHRRTLGVVYCFGRGDRIVNLNSELLRTGNAEITEGYCESSEFSEDEWVISFGCLSE